MPLFSSYHPSQRNTFTGTLTELVLDDVLLRARHLMWRWSGQTTQQTWGTRAKRITMTKRKLRVQVRRAYDAPERGDGTRVLMTFA